jgi:hypothetical protein
MTDRDPDASATEIMESACALAMLPLTMTAAWWEATLMAWQPRRAETIDPEDHECHALHVPDPVEEDGERALFA